MTLRRYAPLALAALALACQPKIDENPNPTTVDYALFNPSASQVPTPNDIALSAVTAFLPGGAYASASCTLAGSAQATALCAYARAGGFPAPSPVDITFLRGTLASDGKVSYAPAPTADALDTATLAFAGASVAPTIGIIDTTASAPVTTATPSFAAASGKLTLVAPGSLWTKGHKYAVMVLGGARGPKTLTGGAYVAMPPFYVLREAVVADLDLTDPANQGLFPGTDAQKAASGAALTPLKIGYRGFYELAGPSLALLNLPFEEAAIFQTFQVEADFSVTIGDGTATVTSTSRTSGTTTPAAVDAFSVETTGAAATGTLTALTVDLSASDIVPASVFVSAASDCSGTPLGTATPVSVASPIAITLPAFLSATPTSGATDYFVCITPPASGAGEIKGKVATVVPFTGLTFGQTNADASFATITIVAAP
jgi:hypothetical protein